MRKAVIGSVRPTRQTDRPHSSSPSPGFLMGRTSARTRDVRQLHLEWFHLPDADLFATASVAVDFVPYNGTPLVDVPEGPYVESSRDTRDSQRAARAGQRGINVPPRPRPAGRKCVTCRRDSPGSLFRKVCDWAHRDFNSFPCLTVSRGKVHYNSILAP